jgi:conjugative transfer region protein (TIGR03748 family)
MRQLPYPTLLSILALSLMLTGCAGHTKRPSGPPAKPVANRSDAQTNPAVSGNRQVKTLEPIRVQTGRYSVVTARPSAEQIDPLLMVVDVRLPRDILTVRDAAEYLLRHSGYRLAGPAEHSPKAQVLLNQTVPDVQRHLGPLTVQDALRVLGGPAFRLQVDPVHRVVTYELLPNYQMGGL